MPYPAQIDPDTIVTQARQMIAVEGMDKLTLAKLAADLGVKAPSLYRHVGSKQKLLQLVNLVTLDELFGEMGVALGDVSRPSSQRLLSLLHAYRAYALAHPNLYVLALTSQPGEARPDEELLVQMVLPIQAVLADVVGEAQSLAALRGALALVHGYVMLEIHNQLQRGGDLDAAFGASAEAFLRGWQTA